MTWFADGHIVTACIVIDGDTPASDSICAAKRERHRPDH